MDVFKIFSFVHNLHMARLGVVKFYSHFAFDILESHAREFATKSFDKGLIEDNFSLMTNGFRDNLGRLACTNKR